MKKLVISAFALALFTVLGCQKENPSTPEEKAIIQGPYTAPLVITGEITSRSGCDWTVVPAGSVDALAAAIASTCDHGIVYLLSGMHTENQPITITKPVKIIGASGAVLKIASAVSNPTEPTDPLSANPALHFLNAPGSLVQDLEILPIGNAGGTSILMENSHGSGIMRNKFNDFQFSIVIEKSDRMTIMFNNIKATELWQTGDLPAAHGIVVINGTSAYLSDNEVSGGLFGIWACDRWGTLERNYTYGNYIGVILCNVPTEIELPSGEITGSLVPATGWKVRNCNSTDNFDIGYIVIDGANNNLLENNNASNNGSYDMELTTDTYRFGFLTPAAYKNTVIAGAYPNITIKDCGNGNTVVGGVQVDTGSDPCN